MTETEVRAFVTRYFQAALQEDDPDVFTGLFTEDGILEDPVGTPPHVGRAKIREFLQAGRALIAEARPTVHDIKVCGDESAVRWSVEARTHRGETLEYDGVGIFMFAAPDRLRHVREYYDVAQLARLFAGTSD